MTTMTSVRVGRVEGAAIDPDDLDLEAIRDGLSDAFASVTAVGLEELYRNPENPVVLAFERDVVDAAIAEIAPQVADMMRAAIDKRLPWTWEPK